MRRAAHRPLPHIAAKAASRSPSLLAFVTKMRRFDLRGGVLDIPHLARGGWDIRIKHRAKVCDLWHEFFQHAQALLFHVIGQNEKASSVAARPIRCFDQPGLDWIAAHPENDWDGRGRRACCPRRGIPTDGHEHVYAAADKFCGKCREPVIVTVAPSGTRRSHFFPST